VQIVDGKSLTVTLVTSGKQAILKKWTHMCVRGTKILPRKNRPLVFAHRLDMCTLRKKYKGILAKV
jgi:hypothetical protein